MGHNLLLPTTTGTIPVLRSGCSLQSFLLFPASRVCFRVSQVTAHSPATGGDNLKTLDDRLHTAPFPPLLKEVPCGGFGHTPIKPALIRTPLLKQSCVFEGISSLQTKRKNSPFQRWRFHWINIDFNDASRLFLPSRLSCRFRPFNCPGMRT